MNTLILNGLSSTPFTLLNYNRNTSFTPETHEMNSVAYFDIENGPNVAAQLQNVGKNGVTNILIKHDGENIYNLVNLNASITTISETLYDNTIHINVSVNFS